MNCASDLISNVSMSESYFTTHFMESTVNCVKWIFNLFRDCTPKSEVYPLVPVAHESTVLIFTMCAYLCRCLPLHNPYGDAYYRLRTTGVKYNSFSHSLLITFS